MHTTGHVLFLYRDEPLRVNLLVDYFKDGFAQGDLCILAASSPQDEIISDLKSVGLDIKLHMDRGDLRIFDMRKTYLNSGKFVSDYMLRNVQVFLSDAHKLGYKGLRTAGEMSWLEENPEWRSAATEYEKAVGHLTDTDPSFTGICLYRLGSDTTELVKDALNTHSSFIYDGKTYQNPYYEQKIDTTDSLERLKELLEAGE